MENTARVDSWWKKRLSLRQFVIYPVIALFCVLVGLSVSWGLKGQKQTALIAVPAMVQSPQTEVYLQITNPVEGSVVEKSQVKITGKTIPNSSLIIFGQQKSKSGYSSESGEFEIDFDLSTGVNVLTVTAITPSREEASVSREVTFSNKNRL